MRGQVERLDAVQSGDLSTFFNSPVYSQNLGVIKRFYYYPWLAPAQSPVPGKLKADTSLIARDGRTRPVYCVFRRQTSPSNTTDC